MTPGERRTFLLHGTRTGKLAITRRDGSPYVLPVWFVLDGAQVVFTTGAETARGRALRRDGGASLCVDDDSPPYAFVRINGRVRLSEDLEQMRIWARRIAVRYMGEALADRYAARNAVAGEMLVHLVPDAVVGQTGVAD